MKYAQVRRGQKLHLVAQPGEDDGRGGVVRKGYFGLPLCGRHVWGKGYRMTINVPLGAACKNCLRVWHARHSTGAHR